jgi:hypothetical protein
VSSAFGVGFWLGPLPHQRAAGGPVSGVHGERCRPNTLRAVAVDLKAIFIGNREGPDEATGFSHRVGRYRFIRSRSGQARATMSRSPGRACLAGPVRAGQPGPGRANCIKVPRLASVRIGGTSARHPGSLSPGSGAWLDPAARGSAKDVCDEVSELRAACRAK